MTRSRRWSISVAPCATQTPTDAAGLPAQECFGQNQFQYKRFDWKSLENQHGRRGRRDLYGSARGPSFPLVRTLTALALALLACAPADRGDAAPDRDARPSVMSNGPDPIVLRVPRDGGAALAYVYPALDSVVWKSSGSLPALNRVLSFDAELGSLAFVDGKGFPGRLDLRLGSVSSATKTTLTGISSADAEVIYGIDESGKVLRLTPSSEAWELELPSAAQAVIPQPDGWLLVLANRPDSARGKNASKESVLWRLRPPEKELLDTIVMPRVGKTIRTRVGDLIYLVADDRLLGIRSRTMETMPTIEFDDPVIALAPTPSGDRLFVAVDSSDRLSVVDRYTESIGSRVKLPGAARDLRMDHLGRYLLVRPLTGDSVWVVGVSNGELVGTLGTDWRTDLPFVAPDGDLALLRGKDVVFADAASGAERARVEDGANDFWYAMSWSGFRPRSEQLDDPVEFRVRRAPVDTAPPDTAPPVDTAPPPSPDTVTAPKPPAPAGFTVSFAALLDQTSANELAQEIAVDGQRARVVVGQRAGTPIYRVVLGPYSTRADAERIGRASGRTYFVYEGNP